MSQRIYVQLGRIGDILNILPLAYDDFVKTGQRSAVMASQEFAPVLDGCSYVDKIVYNGPMFELDKATAQAEKLSDNVKVVQLTGPYEMIKQIVVTRNGAEYRTTTESFLKDQWNLAGRLGDWKLQLPLVFDQRSPEREAALCEQMLPPKKVRKKVILVSVCGISSPFPHKDLLLDLLKLKFWRQYDILDISAIRAERFYDLLGLFESERVHCLIASDSAPLHLAYACKQLPVCALVQDRPSLWHGSTWRPNHISHIRYRDFPTRYADMLRAIEDVGKQGCWFHDFPGEASEIRKVIHVWSEYERNGDPMPETRIGWVQTPVEIGAVGHDSKFSRKGNLKDALRYPFVKDVIRLACLRAGHDDTICLTRAGTKVIPNNILPEPCYAHRTVHFGGDQYERHPAVDLFSFTKAFWQNVQHEYPDMILGKDPYWHRVLKEVFVRHGAKEATMAAIATPKPLRSNSSEGGTPPRVSYNERLASEYMKRHGIACAVPPVHEQVKLAPLNPKGIQPYGYNPSIIRHGGKLLMAYRHHQETGTPATSLSIAELDDEFNPIVDSPIHVSGVVPERSLDDPRLFSYGGELYCAYVYSTWPQNPPTCVVRYGKLVQNGNTWSIPDSFQIKYSHNDGSGMEKNWVPFEHDGKLYFIYHNHPKQVVIQVVGDQVVTEHESRTPHWYWGKIHAGTTPVKYGDLMLRFFHTRMDNEPPPLRWRYYVGACLMNPNPPFQINFMFTKPIIIGSESDRLSVMEKASIAHHKQNVVFPGGCVVNECTASEGGSILLSCGVNDAESVIVQLTEEDLKR